MRWMRYFVVLCVLLPFKAPAQQYSEAVCMLLQQQVDRYANQKNHPNYRNAKSQYDKNCYKVTPRRQLPVEAEPTVTEKPQPRLEYKRAARPDVSKPQPQHQLETPPAATDTEAQVKIKTKAATDESADQHATVPSATQQHIESTQSAGDVALDAATDKAGNEIATVGEADETTTQAAETTDTVLAETTAAEQIIQATANAPLLSEPELGDEELHKLLLEVLQVTPLVAANIVAFLLVVFLLTNWLGLNLPGFKGVFAEYKLNRLLLWRLSREYQHFRKLRLTNDNNESVVIDHLVLSPYGIFVIMVKGYRGRIEGSESQANWTREYMGNSKQFMNPLHQNFKNMQALKQLLGLPGFELMHSVIAFARVGQFASALPANITYVDTTSNYIKQCTERVINDEQLARFSAIIKQLIKDS